MASVLADQQIDLEYLRDPLSIEAVDQDALIADLGRDLPAADSDASGLAALQLTDHDHVVIATGRPDERAIGVLAAQDRATTHEPFLLLAAAFVRPDMRGARLLRRMAAAMMLRIAGLDAAPTVIAACVGDAPRLAALRAFGASFAGAACFPPVPGDPIQLRSAALAQRVARALYPAIRFEMSTGTLRGALAARGEALRAGASAIDCLLPCDEALFLIDLRTETEAGIVEDARRLYRGR